MGEFQIIIFSVVLLVVTKPVGIYILKVYDGSFRWLGPVERFIYRVCGIDADEDQHWTQYAAAMLVFSAATMPCDVCHCAPASQHVFPLNPFHRVAVPDRQAFETAASFSTNTTNWQSYSGETAVSVVHFSQMTQLAFHNFMSAASGVALAVAFARGIARRSAGRIGNFWTDLIRGTLYLFIPASVILALLFVQQGVIQNFHPYVTATRSKEQKQVFAMGPVASREAIKQLAWKIPTGVASSTANSAHPVRKTRLPGPTSSKSFTIFIIPAGLVLLRSVG